MNKEYRNLIMMETQKPQKRFDSEYYVEGLATTFDDPYLLYDFEDFKVYEQISRNALLGADMSDVKFQINHTGTVYARMKQNTLGIDITDKGIVAYADLSKTTKSRSAYEDIAAGYIDQMSWAFTVDEEDYAWNEDMTVAIRTIQKVKKVYEVSGVTEPANPNTEIEAKSLENIKGKSLDINARTLYNGVIESREQELLVRNEKARKKFIFETENMIMMKELENEIK